VALMDDKSVIEAHQSGYEFIFRSS